MHIIGDGQATNLWSDPWLKQGRIRDLVGDRIWYDLRLRSVNFLIMESGSSPLQLQQT